MKRKIFYCLLTSFVASILLLILTLKFTSISGTTIMLSYFIYFCITSAVLISLFDIIENNQLKSNQCALLSTIDAWINLLSLIFGLYGITATIRNTALKIFAFTCILLPFFCSFWSKYDKIENKS